MKLLVQEFLMAHSFADLIRDHGIYASPSKSKKKISLNYSQLETKEDDVLSWDCRGLILARADCGEFPTIDGKLDLEAIVGETQVLAYPMKRFFNYGQGAAADINWHDPNLAVLEKMDGSLCIVYYDFTSHEWCVATRSVPDADILLDNGIYTFRTLFDKALEETCQGISLRSLSLYFDKGKTYCFELTTPLNRIVVNYPNYRVTLLAVRDLTTGNELSFDNHDLRYLTNAVPVVQAHTYTSINELVDWVFSLNPTEHEGVVIRDFDFNRIKVKNAQYVALNKCRDALISSPRNCLELILDGREDDVISFLPQEIANNLLSIKDRLKTWLMQQEHLYGLVLDEASSISLGDKKTFALTLNKYPFAYRPAFFSVFDKKAENIRDFITKNRKAGTWSGAFLDKILSSI